MYLTYFIKLSFFAVLNNLPAYKGELAASRWRSRFGRPAKIRVLGDVDPTGSYCPVPEDWLKKHLSTIGFRFVFFPLLYNFGVELSLNISDY